MAAAMGWRMQEFAGERVLQHGGEVSNYRADMLIMPGHGIGVVVLANANNGLVAQLHLDQIAPGVLRLLLGQPEAEKRLPFAAFTLLVKSVVLLLSAGQVWAWRRLLSGRSNTRRPRMKRAIFTALVGDLLAPLLLLWGVPRWSRSPRSLLRQYVPDLSSWLLTTAALLLLRGAVRLLKR